MIMIRFTTSSGYTRQHIVRNIHKRTIRTITGGKVQRNHVSSNVGNSLRKISHISWRGIATASTQNEAFVVQYKNYLLNTNDKNIPIKQHESQHILSCSMVQKDQLIVRSNDRMIVKKVADKIIQYAKILWDAIMVLIRTSEIGLRFSPLIVLTPAAILASQSQGTNNDTGSDDDILSRNDSIYNQDGTKKTSMVSDATWKYTLYTIQKLGPAFIKISQWAASRRDIFPPHVCDRLSELHDATFTHSWSHTQQVLKQALGDDYEDRLKVDKDDILGSGSVAQVYSGVWENDDIDNINNVPSKNKRKVAVKVLHPNIRHLVERDLRLMERVAKFVDSLPSETIKMLSLPRACKNFTNIMHLQIDLRNESNNLDQFRDNFDCKNVEEKQEREKVSFPEPILCETNCLVEDYMGDSRPISEYLLDDSVSGMSVRRELAGPLLRAFLKMVFMDNFVHCDLHPGNILVRKIETTPPIAHSWWDSVVKSDDGRKSAEEEKYTIVFLDAGIVTALNDSDQQNLKDLFKAVILNNGEEAGRLMVERAKYERCSQSEGGVETFSKGIGEIVADFHDRRKQGLTLGVVRIGSLLGRVLELCRLHGVEIDPAMANIVMSTLVLEGLGRALEPDLNLFDIALPFVLGRGKV